MTHTIATTRAAAFQAAFARLKPVLDSLHEVIAAAGDDGIPSGHLYAMLMSKVDLDRYNELIAIMVEAGGITLTNHVLRAVK